MSNAAAFATTLSGALRRINSDETFPPEVARELRAAIAATDVASRHDVASRPDHYLGEFDAFPEHARNSIINAIVACDRLGPRGYRLGPLFALILRALWRLKHAVYRAAGEGSAAGRPLRGIADVLAYGTRKAPAFALQLLHRKWHIARALHSSRPRLLDMLMLADMQPFDLAVGFARGIPQQPPYRGYWRDPKKHIVVGRVLGLDLLPAADGFWYVESNVHPALEAPRSMLFDRDPMCQGVVRFAAMHGFQRLMLLDNTSSGIDPRMADGYVAEAARAGIELSLPVLPNVPGPALVRSWAIPRDVKEKTLIVRIRPYPVCMDHMLGSKRATYRALQHYQEHTQEAHLKLPPTDEAPRLASVDGDDPFPNLVYKLPDIEQGRGVWFLKARSVEHAREVLPAALSAPRRRSLEERALLAVTNKEGVFQPFIASKLLEDGRMYKIRALVLVSPLGVKCLSAHRIIAVDPVPKTLEFGVVADIRPYMINSSMGGKQTVAPDDEIEGAAEAAEAAGRGFARAIERAFRVGPR